MIKLSWTMHLTYQLESSATSDSSSTTQTSACPFPLCVGLPLTSVDNNLSNDILIYPNPSSGILNLKSITEIEQYSIFNIYLIK